MTNFHCVQGILKNFTVLEHTVKAVLFLFIVYTKIANTKKQSHIASTKAKELVKQYPEDFCEDSRHLFGKFCQKIVPFHHLSTIKEHFTSDKHINLKIKADMEVFIT